MRVCSSWRAYWFGDGGRTSVAVLRIAVAISVWLTITKMQGSWPANAPGAPSPPTVYRPVGIWMLLGAHVPPSGVIAFLWPFAKASTIFMLAGAASRLSTALSFAATLALASLYYSGFPAWSHGFNVVLLAQLALLGARSGDTLSVDSLIRRFRGQTPANEPGGYLWSVRLVQLAVAVMFLSGMFHKVMQGGFTLDWAFSDNLRNQILVRFDLASQPRTAIADWIIDDPWKYRTAASLNLISQTLPIGACIFTNRPWLRAGFGAFFVIETVALALVMDLWNLHWLPLAAVFVDWERLLGRLSPRMASPAPTSATAPPTSLPKQIFVTCFVAYDLVTAFVPHVDQKLNTYPFSSFPMFAVIRARQPYSTHQLYTFSAGEFEILSATPPTDAATRWINYSYRKTFSARSCAELHTRMTSMLADARFWVPSITGLRYHFTILEAPAYPARAALVSHRIGTIAELGEHDAFACKLGKARLDAGHAEVTPAPDAGPLATLAVYRRDNLEPAQSLPGPGPWTIEVARNEHIALVGIDAAGTRWLVATLPR